MAIFIVPTQGVKPKSAFASCFPAADFEKIWSYAHSLMAEGEHIEHMFMQNRWCLKIFPGVLVLTNRRAIFIKRGVLSTTFDDFYWRMFKDVQKEERWSGSVLRFTTVNNRMYQMLNIPQDAARGAYAFAQAIEELAFEFRRYQRLEEERASARGVALPADTVFQPTTRSPYAPQNTAFPSSQPEPQPSASSFSGTAVPSDGLAQAIADLKALRSQGVIDEQEYQNRLRILIEQT